MDSWLLRKRTVRFRGDPGYQLGRYVRPMLHPLLKRIARTVPYTRRVHDGMEEMRAHIVALETVKARLQAHRAIAYEIMKANLDRERSLNLSQIGPEPPKSANARLKRWLGNPYAIALAGTGGRLREAPFLALQHTGAWPSRDAEHRGPKTRERGVS